MSWFHPQRSQRRPCERTASVEMRTAFVLSGGGPLGAIQAGQLRAVLEAGIKPDLIIGVSAGALNGAAIAAAPVIETAVMLEQTWSRLRREDVFAGTASARAWHLVRRHPNVFDPSGLAALVAALIHVDDLADLSVEFEAVTLNLDASRLDYHRSGNPAAVLLASSALPGMFPPVVIDGDRHVDGGIANNLPLQRARDLGVTRIIAFDCRAGTDHHLPMHLSALDVVAASFGVARSVLTVRCVGSDVVMLPAPDTTGIAMNDFSHGSRLVTSSYELVARFLESDAGAVLTDPLRYALV